MQPSPRITAICQSCTRLTEKTCVGESSPGCPVDFWPDPHRTYWREQHAAEAKRKKEEARQRQQSQERAARQAAEDAKRLTKAKPRTTPRGETGLADWTCQEIGPRFVQACREAAADNGRYKRFRSNPYICAVVETRPVERIAHFLCQAFLAGIDQDKALKVALINDAIGAPKCGSFASTKISGTTAAYLNTIAQLTVLFGPLDGLSVAEIGGGYGGLAAIATNYYKPARYVIHDIPDVQSLQQRFCRDATQFPVEFAKESTHECDLVISSCALSELTDSGMQRYKSLLHAARCGYITWSVTRESVPWANDEREVAKRLAELSGRPVVQATKLKPMQQYFGWWAPYIYTWGHDENCSADHHLAPASTTRPSDRVL